MKPLSAAKAQAQDNAQDKAAMKHGKSHTSHQCPHCGKYHTSGPIEGDGDPSDNDGQDDQDPDHNASDSAADLIPTKGGPVETTAPQSDARTPVSRAKNAVKSKLAQFAKRDKGMTR